MKAIIPLLLALCLTTLAGANPEREFFADLQRAQAKYRASQSKLLEKADRVIVYIVKFDDLSDVNLFADNAETISVAPNAKETKILKTKELGKEDREKLLQVLSARIAEPEHSGGAFCHFPIHGIRIYRGEELLHEGTFCWACGNFSFKYPQGADWLDTTPELEQIFTRLLPVPKEELERFREKYPEVNRSSEDKGK